MSDTFLNVDVYEWATVLDVCTYTYVGENACVYWAYEIKCIFAICEVRVGLFNV